MYLVLKAKFRNLELRGSPRPSALNRGTAFDSKKVGQ